MKKILLVLLVLVSFSFAQEWNWQVISWNSGDATSDTLITTGIDTSDWFTIASGGAFAKQKMPETLSFLLWADQTVSTDSTQVAFALQLSNDKTYLHNYGTLATLSGGTTDIQVDDKIATDFALFKYGRIIATCALAAGDSLASIGAQVSKDFSNY